MDISPIWLVGGITVFFMLMGGFYAFSPKKIHVIQSLWSDLLQRITVAGLVLAVAFLGWRLMQPSAQCSETLEKGTVEAVSAVADAEGANADVSGDRVGASSSSPAAKFQGRDERTIRGNSSRIWRVTLWLNLCLALPWITAFATRYVLALKSNAASFALLSGYVVLDMALGMTVGMISFVAWGGAALLVGLMVLAFGYNYWCCELVSRLWQDGDFGRRRRG
ncbi:MAG: hypothetical protein ACI87O_001155 [Planctomycetota bacterium]|jgi:hypothetical protein